MQDYVERATGANLGGPLPPDLSDATLEQLLFPKQASAKPGMRRHPEPDRAVLVLEMKRPCVSLMILLEDYQAVLPKGYGYSRYVAAAVM